MKGRAAPLALIALFGCGDHALEWSIVPAGALHEAQVAAVSAEIATGSCATPGEVIFEAAATRPSAPDAPGTLPAGSYAFRARSTDAACRVTATGCTDVRLPVDGTLITVLEPTGPAAPECAADRCTGGMCASGATDAGVVDAACTGAPSCAGGILVTCREGVPVITTCPLGCAAGGDRCSTFVPSNVPLSLLTAASGEVLVDDATIDTTACTGIPELSMQTSVVGQTLCVLAAGDVSIVGTVVATGEHPLVIVASGEIAVAGALDLAARATRAGAAGANGTAGDGGGPSGGRAGDFETAASIKSGGAGASLCGRGGDGGDSGGGDSSDPLTGPSGPPPVTTELEPLLGGSAGGAGGLASAAAGGLGGGGGGAVQLTALGAIRIVGTIDVSGGGGGGGAAVGPDGSPTAGGGGGSGGGILIESPSIEISPGAILRAAGGGGGGSGATAFSSSRGEPGEDGRLAGLGRAGGGRGGDRTGYEGGAGGGASTPNGDPGADAEREAGDGGGGGGGAGCIVLRTNDPLTPDPSTLNPTTATVLPLRPER